MDVKANEHKYGSDRNGDKNRKHNTALNQAGNAQYVWLSSQVDTVAKLVTNMFLSMLFNKYTNCKGLIAFVINSRTSVDHWWNDND
jgi:hypothetical protein